jgi:two-component system alkaline phosphatase synthesis response regulator PhoP
MDGIEVLSQIRRESEAYVIMLTAKSEEVDKIVGLSIGADDYLTKPFSPRELMARIKAALRRLQKPSAENDRKVITLPHIRIDTGSRRVWIDEQEIELTTLEFDLLVIFAEYHGMVLSREKLLEQVWGYDYFGDLRVVDVHVGHLRQKIGSRYIETVRGAGYRFEDKQA